MNTRPHVLMLLDNGFAPDPRVEKEARSLAAAGIGTIILAWDWQGGRSPREAHDGYKIERIVHLSSRDKKLRQLGPLAVFAEKALLRSLRCDFDVIYVHDFPLLPLGVILSSLHRRPLVYDAHELYWLMEYKRYPSWITDVMRRVEIMLLKRAHTVITISQYLASYYQRFHPRVVVVGNWFDRVVPSEAHQSRAACRRALGIPDGAICVGAIGGFRRRYIDCLIKATRLAPGCHVIIAGRGSGEAHIAELASQYSNAHFLGWRDDTTGIFAACDALYHGIDKDHPYTRYSSPNTLFRAISRGIPLLTPPIGEGGMAVREMGCGLLIDPLTPETVAAAIQQLQNPTVYSALCERARSAQAEYLWSRASTRLVQAVLDATGLHEGSELCVE